MRIATALATILLLAGLGLLAPRAIAEEEAARPSAETAAPADIQAEARERLLKRAGEGDAAAAYILGRALVTGEDSAARAEGAALLRQAADAGIVPAMLRYAAIVRAGLDGAAPDLAAAGRYYERAAAGGDPAAEAALAGFLLNTQSGAEIVARAVGLLEHAAAAGEVGATNALAQLYLRGFGVPRDAPKALAYLDAGIVAGSDAARLAYADVLRYGAPGVEADPGAARDLYRAAAADPLAIRRLADMTARGEAGLDPDFATAEAMLVGLAEAGDPAAYQLIGDYHLAGEATPRDVAAAVSWYERSADAGNAAALVRLGDLYRTGTPGLARDLGAAIRWFELGVATGSAEAMRALAGIYLGEDLAHADSARGIALLERAAEAGSAAAALDLGRLYASGDRVAADYALASRYFARAGDLGDPAARIAMASALATGPLATQYGDEAAEVLADAVAKGIPGAAGELARLQLAGLIAGGSIEGVIATLKQAADAGDTGAARFLVQLYRDGYGIALAPDLAAAETLLGAIEPSLDAEIVAVERILLAARRAASPADFAAIGPAFAALRAETAVQLVPQLRRINAAAYVYLVQQRLAGLGLYDGPLSGALDTATLEAVRALCEEAGVVEQCSAGPLSDAAVAALSGYLFLSPA